MSNKKGVILKNLFVKLKNDNLTKLLLSALILFFILNMIISPAKFIAQGLNGISAWAFNVLPSVLPFMFFTKALSLLGQIEKLTHPFQRVTKALFNTPPISFYTFFMAILSGYPVGSKMIADLYMQGKITKNEAFRMSAFCSTSGPMFIIGAVGVGMFKSSIISYILFLSHVFSAFLNGLIYRKLGCKKNDYKNKQNKSFQIEKTANKSENNNRNMKISKQIKNGKFQIKNVIDKQSKDDNIDTKIDTTNQNDNTNLSKENNISKTPDISEIVLSSTLAILSVGCIITIFFIIIECLSPIFNLFPENISAFLEGLVEITKGCLSLSALPNVKLAVILASFVISFGGISTLLQSLTMLQQVKMPVKLFALQKLTHALLSALISTILVLVFM